MKALVFLANGCEELEAVTVIDLLRRAQVEVVSAGLGGKQEKVVCSRQVGLVPDVSLDEVLHEEFDLVVLPGGQPGTDNLRKDERVKGLLQRHNKQAKFIGAICAAPMVLAEAGLLEGRNATSYPGCLNKEIAPTARLQEEKVVVDGNIITSKGPGTAMDFALTLIELLTNKRNRANVEAGLQR